MEIKTKFNLDDNVFIEYNGRFLECKVYGICTSNEIFVSPDTKDEEGIEVCEEDISKEILYTFYVNQRDSSGKRKLIKYNEKNVFATKEELISSIKFEKYL